MGSKQVFRKVARVLEIMSLVEDDIEPGTLLDQLIPDDVDKDDFAYNLEDVFDLDLGDKLNAGYFTTVGELAEYIWEEL